ncbi:GerMN domain-containing protein [Cohnella thailandensis]|uniref:GerMN domain-containing protein n=1 Tax=Cohnella thailandensis TaxID=557557 RepID=A0A841SWT3_9BACL|nr:GerMN domain-containing protein [Cohnella thailandensis]MBB6636374.1 GerMN domain-containing protein [Cohnella thailandensis]MBP1973656.1 putative small lipoprotein YifL [Cohnella thailandensis]
MRKIGCFMLLIALISLLAGCGDKPIAAPGSSGGSESVANSSSGEVAEPAEEETPSPSATDTLTIQTYYTDDNILDLKQESQEIEVTAGQSKYEGAFKALQTEKDGLIALWERVVLNSLSFSEENGRLAIDISLPDEARLGSGGEALAIDALKQTMFQFDEVKEIELTLDGQQVDSLMGHVELEHPMLRP